MTKLTSADLRCLMDNKENIRNISVIEGKCLLTDSLVAAAGIIPKGNDTIGEDEMKCFIPTGSCGISLLHQINPYEDDNKYLINLVDLAEHNKSECDAALRITDGALVVADCMEGITLQSKVMLQQALSERIRPVLALNNVDNCFLELKLGGEEAYQSFSSIIKDVNDIISPYKDKLLGDGQLHPREGTVIFSSGSWAFSIADFAKMYASRFGSDEEKLKKRLWGDHFYDPETKRWTASLTSSATCKRGFVHFLYEPITKVVNSCLHDQTDRVLLMLKKLGHDTIDLHNLTGKNLIEHVMGNWLPASRVLLEMIIFNLPSPPEAHKYRAESFCKEPLDDAYVSAIKKCDCEGPPLLYLSATVPTRDGACFFGRVVAGTVAAGQKVRVMGLTYDYDRNSLFVKRLQQTVTCMGKEFMMKKLEPVDTVPCGNMIALIGIDQYIAKNAFPTQKISQATKYKKCGESEDGHITLKPMGGLVRRNYRLPLEVAGRLAPYQKDAVRWLWGLHCSSAGGVLADDMGMGKTRTVCSFLRGLLHSGLIERAIIVAPKTILTQWADELNRVGLTDEIKMYRTPISQGSSLQDVIQQGGVLLTTYEVFRSKYKAITCEDTNMLQWDYIFLDEGHRIKNDKTQTSRAFNALKCHHKIIMTGTPFQNNLKELYVLVNFCCPDLLGNEQEYNEKFVLPIERAKFTDSELVHKRLSMSASEVLRKLLKPFMLRRTKRLLQEMSLLGNKYEMTVWLKMTTQQIDLYGTLVTKVDLGNSEGAPFAEAVVAKNICNHPSILRKEDSGDSEVLSKTQGLASSYRKQLLALNPFHGSIVESSCKSLFIVYLVKKLLKEKHKILIFSQSISMLELIEKALLKFMEKSKIIRMDGGTSQCDRDDKIKDFQANIENPEEISPDDVPDIFLMTTSVGGMGLNLTAASRVIIVDPAQNPSMDNQSVDRAYRLGQKKDVIVYRLITSGTIEEHTYRCQVIKGEVSTSVTENEQCIRALEKETGKVLSLPKAGFGTSLTYEELVDSYGNCFEKSVHEDLNFVEQHESVIGVNNHGSLFSIDESLPWLCEHERSQVDFGRSLRKKVPSDTVIGGENHAYGVKHEIWGFGRDTSKGGTAHQHTAALQPRLNRVEIPGRSTCLGDVSEQRHTHKTHGVRSGNDPPP